jgi:hypothetical protein
MADDDDTTEQPSPNKCPRIKEEVELETHEHHQSSSTNPVLYWPPDRPEARQVFQPTSSGRSANSRRKRRSVSAAPVGNNAPELKLQRRHFNTESDSYILQTRAKTAGEMSFWDKMMTITA